eukprot:6722044-Prymnesium_polylepis.1
MRGSDTFDDGRAKSPPNDEKMRVTLPLQRLPQPRRRGIPVHRGSAAGGSSTTLPEGDAASPQPS